MFCNLSLLGSEVKSEPFLLGEGWVTSLRRRLLPSVSYVGSRPLSTFRTRIERTVASGCNAFQNIFTLSRNLFHILQSHQGRIFLSLRIFLTLDLKF